ncbi:glycosyltransferase family 4 protein, partial [Pediococcus ethanolidurans]|uniref:glycosyltransferase family 4 protein n=1 Tax=Pediococcus ethanolidurans TaxID=319653 RepID=UPI001C1EC883
RNTFYIPNGVKKSDQIEPSIITKKFGLFGDDYFLTVSRLTPEKGLLPLIESFRGVDTNKKLVIVGDGSDTDEYVKKIIKLSQSDSRIIFTGFVGGRLLSELYSNAFVYIIPSFVEGMPMSLLEALSFGNAVAASNIPEITEVVGRDHALLFSPKDQNQMKNVINRFLHDTRLRRAMKQSSKNYVADKYSWNIVAHETSKVYLQVLFKGE